MKSMWLPLANSSLDDWTIVEDPVKRKRIQDRLAQRARRKRIASRKIGVVPERPDTPCTSSVTRCSSSVAGSPQMARCEKRTATSLSKELSKMHWEQFMTAQDRCMISDPSVDSSFIIMQSVRAATAFYNIAQKLGLSCNGLASTFSLPTQHQQSSLNSPKSSDHFPACFIPTTLQQQIPHYIYIDILPFSSMRNRILESLEALNEEQLAIDLLDGDWRLWGDRPWEPEGWEVGERFAKRWWFLLDADILKMTNFWRRQRGCNDLYLKKQGGVMERNIYETDGFLLENS